MISCRLFPQSRNSDMSVPPSQCSSLGAALVVVPTYNERKNVGELARRLFAATTDVDLLIVDDASPDGTAAACRLLQSEFGRLRLLERTGPRGLGRAYLAGLRSGLESGYPVIGTMDADLSH